LDQANSIPRLTLNALWSIAPLCDSNERDPALVRLRLQSGEKDPCDETPNLFLTPPNQPERTNVESPPYYRRTV